MNPVIVLATSFGENGPPTGWAKLFFGLFTYGPILLIMASPGLAFLHSLYKDFKRRPESAYPTDDIRGLSRRSVSWLATCFFGFFWIYSGLASSKYHDFLYTNWEIWGTPWSFFAVFGPQISIRFWRPWGGFENNVLRLFLLTALAAFLFGWFYNLAWLLTPELVFQRS